LFATLFVFGQLLDPFGLLGRHLDVIFDDCRIDQNHYSKTILSIDEHLSSSNKYIVDFFDIQDMNKFSYSNIADVSSDVNDNKDLDNSSINFTKEVVGGLNKE